MKTYVGYRIHAQCIGGEVGTEECVVHVLEDGKPKRKLPLYLDIQNKSPTGFEWGYGGSGPAQLALALCADCFGRQYALSPIYQRLKWRIVCHLPHDIWRLTEEHLREHLANIQTELQAVDRWEVE